MDNSLLGPGDSAVPIYVRLAASLRARIVKGEWAPGERLPPFEGIASGYGVSMNTVRSAVQLLNAQSVLKTSRGRGTTVNTASLDFAAADARAAMNDPLVYSPHHTIQILTSEPADTLSAELSGKYAEHPRYQHLFKVHSFRGTAYGLVDVYVEAVAYSRFPTTAIHNHKTSLLLRDFGEVRVALSRQELTVVHADQTQAELLHYSVASPLVRVRRWRLDEHEKVVYACTVHYRSDTFAWDYTEIHPLADHFQDQVMQDLRE